MAETNHNNKKNVSLGKPRDRLPLLRARRHRPARRRHHRPAGSLHLRRLPVGGRRHQRHRHRHHRHQRDGRHQGTVRDQRLRRDMAVNMIETNEASLKLRFGTANVTGTADKLTVYHAIRPAKASCSCSRSP